MVAVNKQTTTQQSWNAYNQWCEQWREHAKHHSKIPMKPFSDFENIGIGRPLLLVANGYSLELEIETIKKHQDNVDILCCDKSLGHLLENGITPTYVMICDANVDFEKYLEPWKDKVKDVIAFSNVCGNIKWTEPEYWKDVYFFVNEDVINSHFEFSKLSGCKNFIPAATNVSNQMLVMATQSNNQGRNNFFGYDKVLLIGYDYSWTPNGHYYAFNDKGGGKYNYMRHVWARNLAGDLCYTSNNLLFSMEWLKKYINTFKLPVVLCHDHSILDIPKRASLDSQMQYNYRREDVSKVRKLKALGQELKAKLDKVNGELHGIGKDHYYSVMRTI